MVPVRLPQWILSHWQQSLPTHEDNIPKPSSMTLPLNLRRASRSFWEQTTVTFPTPKQVYLVANKKTHMKMRWSPKPHGFPIYQPSLTQFNLEESWSGKIVCYDEVIDYYEEETSSFIMPQMKNNLMPWKTWSQWTFVPTSLFPMSNKHLDFQDIQDNL